jgi:hypothetical protein
MKIKLVAVSMLVLVVSLGAFSQANSNSKGRIPKGAKLFIAPMPDSFDTYIKAAIDKKKVPVEIVDDKSKAQYQITGASESQKAGAAKKILALDWRSTEEASIQVANLESGEVVFAYSVHLQSSNHGKQSSAESCAKHLKDHIR